MNNNLLIAVAVLVLIAVGFLIYAHYKKRNLEQFFNQVYEQSKQIPKQKKNSFLLLMFKESLSASKNKVDASKLASKLNNPKYLDIQLVQMSNILKNKSNVQDKVIKQSLNLLNHYYKWEKEKINENKKVIENKAS